jgi:hypothetical protein
MRKKFQRRGKVMTNRDPMKKRRLGSLITFLGIALLILSPVFLVFGTFIITILFVILGIILIFYGLSVWKTSMHEMRVRHTAIQSGRKQIGYENENVIHTKEKGNYNFILIGLVSGFFGFMIHQVLLGNISLVTIYVAYLYADFIYIIVGGLIVGLICLFYSRRIGSPRKCLYLGLLYEVPSFCFFSLGIGEYWTKIPIILTPLAFLSFGVLGYIAGYIGMQISPEPITYEQRPLTVKTPDKIKCPSCYAFVSKDFKFCSECGESITSVCPSCNKTVQINAKFCPKCGEKLT